MGVKGEKGGGLGERDFLTTSCKYIDYEHVHAWFIIITYYLMAKFSG